MSREKDWLKDVAEKSLQGCLMNFFDKNPKYKIDPISFVAALQLMINEFAKRFQNPSQYE